MRYYRYAVGLCCVCVATRPAVAQDPFVYFAGNPANAWFEVGGTLWGANPDRHLPVLHLGRCERY
jgi:hypothetical protein